MRKESDNFLIDVLVYLIIISIAVLAGVASFFLAYRPELVRNVGNTELIEVIEWLK